MHFQGLPARICWLGYGDRASAGLIFNDLVASGSVKAPIVIGRDHLDSGSVASPNRETEVDARRLRRDRRLAHPERAPEHRSRRDVGVAPPRRRRRASATRSTPAWWSSPTARPMPARRLERVLTTDPGMGIMRHADAGYPEAIDAARRHGLKLPSTRG